MPGLGLIGGIVLGGTTLARPDAYFNGSVSLAGVGDDNLFFTPESQERDVISRFTPAFQAGTRTERFSLSGRFSLDAERFAVHPELDTNDARELAGLEMESRLARPVTLTLHGDYMNTLTPGELNGTTGITATRARARRASAGPSFGLKLGPKTDGTLAYAWTKDDLAGGITSVVRTSSAGLKHRLSSRTSTTADYSFSRFDFGTGEPIAVSTLTLGFERRFGPHSTFSLRAGPRYSEGRVDPEASLALQHGSGRFDTSVDVARTLGTVIGLPGTFTTESALVGVAYRPLPALRLSVAPGVYRTHDSSGGPETRSSVVNIETGWRIAESLSLVAWYRRNLQTTGVGPVTPGTAATVQEIARDSVFLGVTAGYGGSPGQVAGVGTEGRNPGGDR